MISKDELLKPRELKTVDISVDGLGDCRLIELSASRGAKLEQWRIKNTDNHSLKKKMVVLCLVDENNERLLEQEDFDALENLPWPALNKLAIEAMKLNGLMEEVSDSDFTDESNGTPTAPSDDSS